MECKVRCDTILFYGWTRGVQVFIVYIRVPRTDLVLAACIFYTLFKQWIYYTEHQRPRGGVRSGAPNSQNPAAETCAHQSPDSVREASYVLSAVCKPYVARGASGTTSVSSKERLVISINLCFHAPSVLLLVALCCVASLLLLLLLLLGFSFRLDRSLDWRVLEVNQVLCTSMDIGSLVK